MTPKGLALVVAVALAVPSGAARAYDPATTHAGLTERAVVASGLHRVLVRRLGRPLGLFEPIVFQPSQLTATEGRTLELRLAALDPAGGYRPSPEGVASALAWVIAGSVIAGTPAERGQHMFYDPSRGSGLSDPGGGAQVSQQLRQLIDSGGGVRAFATGTSFNMTGLPSTTWLASTDNDVGLPAYYASLEAAFTAEEPARRSTALARALLALGGTLAVLEDAGEPAHVRNDFKEAYLGSGGSSPFDRGSAFERYVADSYGRIGVPAAGPTVSRPTVMAFITAADAQGLADRTQRRFFSAGSIPEDAIVDRDTTAAEVMRDARASLPYGFPRLPRLELKPMGHRQYVYAHEVQTKEDDAKGEGAVAARKPPRRKLLAYERVPGRVRFFLDRAVYADTARALLPEIGAYAAGLVDHLTRGELKLEVGEGTVAVSLTGTHGAARGGQVRLYAEDAAGRRRPLSTVAPSADPVSVAIPAGTRRIAAVFRGEDDAGELVVGAEAPGR